MITLFRPYYDQREIDAVTEVIKSGWMSCGPKVAEFEKRFAKFVGAKHCVGLNSGTATLDMAMKLLKINHGDEVIVPTMTFVSTAHVVEYNLAKPIFVDVEPDTLNIDIDNVQRRLTDNTKAIIVVHYGGRPVDMDKFYKFIGYGINIVEDCSHAHGALYKGNSVGIQSNMGCWSFHSVKPLAMGEGGAITPHNERQEKRAKCLRWLGIDKSTWDRSDLDKKYWWEYFVDEIGLKSQMDEMHAAIGLVQLEKLSKMNSIKRGIVELYMEGLKDVDEVDLPMSDSDDIKSAWHLFVIKAKKRDDLSVFLRGKGIQAGVHYKPIHLYKCYGNKPFLPVAEKAFKKIMSLPLHPGLKPEDIALVINSIKEFYHEN